MINEKYAKMFCCEDISLIENYQEAINDNTQTWHCHHRLETDLGLSMQELKDSNKYFGIEAKYLIFLRPYEHLHLHGTSIRQTTRQKLSKSVHKYWDVEENCIRQREKLLERYQDQELIKKISNLCSGELNGMYGKSHSDEAKAKMREKRKEYFNNLENRKHLSEVHTGMKLSDETKLKISKAIKGKKKPHYTNPKKVKIISESGEVKEYRKPNAIQFMNRHLNENWRFLEED